MPNCVTLLIILTILLLPTYLVRFSLFSIPTNLFEIATAITIVFLFFYKKRLSLLTLLKNNLAISVIIFLILAGLCFSALMAGTPQASLGIIKSWFVIPIFFSLLLATLRQKDAVRILTLRSLYVSIFSVSSIAISYTLWDMLTYDGRLSAFYLSPNHLAMYLVPGIFIGAYLAKQALSNKRLSEFVLLFISIIPILAALYLTKSYSAWLSVAFAYPILLLFVRSGFFRYFGRIILFLFIFILIILTQVDTAKFLAATHIQERSSLASRIMIWKSAIKIGADNPVWGIGPGLFQEKYLAYQKYFPPYLEWAVPQPHNLYFAFWLQAGVFGFLGFILLIIFSLHRLREMASNKKTASLAVLIAVYLISIMLWGFVDTPYWKNDLAFVFWLMLSPLALKSHAHME